MDKILPDISPDLFTPDTSSKVCDSLVSTDKCLHWNPYLVKNEQVTKLGEAQYRCTECLRLARQVSKWSALRTISYIYLDTWLSGSRVVRVVE